MGRIQVRVNLLAPLLEGKIATELEKRMERGCFTVLGKRTEREKCITNERELSDNG